MPSRSGEPVHVWRTNGGLYLHASGRTGKVCTLRDSPHGVNFSAPSLSALSEVIYTRYGKRYRNIQAGEVRAGMVVRVEPLDGSGFQLSLIQESYAGVRVHEITEEGLFLVFDDQRAALVPGHNPEASLPLFADGWNGIAQSLEGPGSDNQWTRLSVSSSSTTC